MLFGNNFDDMYDQDEKRINLDTFDNLLFPNNEGNQNIGNNFSNQKVEDNIKNQNKKKIEEQQNLCEQETKPTMTINIQIKDEPIKTYENETKELGKKRKRNDGTGSHNKYSDDNIRRKVKHLVLSDTMKLINKKIYDMYEGNIGNGIFKKELLTINQKQKADATVQFNQEFLNKKLGDIFSEDISTRFTIYPLCHNRKIIEELRNDEDNEKRQYFNNLFNLTFLNTLEHFRGTNHYEELNGLSGIDSLKQKFENEDDYLQTLTYYFMNYENITNNKKKRNRTKNNNKKEK